MVKHWIEEGARENLKEFLREANRKDLSAGEIIQILIIAIEANNTDRLEIPDWR